MKHFSTILVSLLLVGCQGVRPYSSLIRDPGPPLFIIHREEAARLAATPAVLQHSGETNLIVQAWDSASRAQVVCVYKDIGNDYFIASFLFTIPSFYGRSRAMPIGVSPIGDGDDVQLLGMLFTGNRGSSVKHDILLVTAWDGRTFRPVMMESATNWLFLHTINCKYDFSTRGQVFAHSTVTNLQQQELAAWHESLKWNSSTMSFYDPHAVAGMGHSRIDAQRAIGVQRKAFLENPPTLHNIVEYDIRPWMDLYVPDDR